MPWYYLVKDENGRQALGGPATGVGPIFTSEIYTVTNSLGQTTFTVVNTLTSSRIIEVTINGVGVDEGSGYDFTRDTGANALIFNYTIPKNARVKIKFY